MKIRCFHCGVENSSEANYCVCCNNNLTSPQQEEEKNDENSVLQIKDNIYWERRKELGRIKAFWLTCKEAVFHPRIFFSQMSIDDGMWSPFLFGMIVGSLGGAILSPFFFIKKDSIFNMNIFYIFPMIPLLTIIKMYVIAFFTHWCLWLIGARNGFRATFRVVAYSEATLLFGAFLLFPLCFYLMIINPGATVKMIAQSSVSLLIVLRTFGFLGLLFSVLWPICLYIIGFNYTHTIGILRSILALFLCFFMFSGIFYMLKDSDISVLKVSDNIKSSDKYTGKKEEKNIKTNCKIEGILFSKDGPSVSIGGGIYFLNDSVCGGRIINISRDRVIVSFQEKEGIYEVGSVVGSNLRNILK